jgi:hypothetical protein
MSLLKSLLTFLAFIFINFVSAQSSAPNKEMTDRTVTLFNDPNYKLTLHIFDPEVYEGDQKNATLTLTPSTNAFSRIIFIDSLFCMHPWIQFEDFNNDKVKDVLVFNFSGARSNWSHYLYLVDNKNHKLTFVKRFSNLLNPELNTSTGVITSTFLYGAYVSYSFFRINKKGILVKTGRPYEENVE